MRRLASQLHQLSAAPAASADGQQPAAYFDADEPLPEFITTDQTSCGLEYTATVGFLPIVLDETDGVVGKMFFVYYAKKGEPVMTLRPCPAPPPPTAGPRPRIGARAAVTLMMTLRTTLAVHRRHKEVPLPLP